MQRSISDVEASDDEQLDVGRIHSQAMVLNKHSPKFLEHSKRVVLHESVNLMQTIDVYHQESLETQQAFLTAVTTLVDASLATNLAQRDFARAMIAPRGPLQRVGACYLAAEEELAAIELQDLEETFAKDRAQLVDVLGAGKRVVTRELADGVVKGNDDEGSDEKQVGRMFETGEARKVGREVQDGLEGIERMVRKATRMIPVE